MMSQDDMTRHLRRPVYAPREPRARYARLGAALLTAASLCLLFVSAQPVSFAETDAAPSGTVTFTKEFPGSDPAYYSVAVRENGQAQYRTAPDDPPIELQLSPVPTEEIFSLARKLSFFRNAQFESKRRVANMGKKTLAYQNGPDRAEASFNHTEIPEALALTALFEKISLMMQHQLRLEYMMRYDRLGIVKELLQLEVHLDQQSLLEPDHLLPVLEQIQKDPKLVNVAQERAAQIIGKIKSRE
jgi:hypothetical protein